MRTVCPASSRFFGSVRLPLTRTSPLRMTRWMWEKLKPRKPRLEKAVDPHAGFVGRDRNILHAGRQRSRRNLLFSVIRRSALRARLGGRTATGFRAMAEFGFTRFRLSKCRVGSGQLGAPLRSRLGVTLSKTLAMPRAGLCRGPALCRPPPGWRGPRLPLILPLRSRRSFAQYSRRLLISRSKPRSGGS